MPVAPTPEYKSNLAALRSIDQALANRLEQTPLPPNVVNATGRDGAATFQLHDDGECVWFGQSSMPQISSQAMITELKCGHANVILPGVLTGREIIEISRKLPGHRGIFVTEADALQVKLAAHLVDYSSLIEAGRLVFLLGGDIEESLCGFFDRKPGYEAPGQLIQFPHWSGGELAAIKRAIERAVSRIASKQASCISELAAEINSQQRELPSSRPRLAVVSADPGQATASEARRCQRAADQLGLDDTVCIPDRPGACHVVARLQAIRDANADFVLNLNGNPGLLESLLGEHLKVTTIWTAGSDPRHVEASSGKSKRVYVYAMEAVGDAVTLQPAADDLAFFPKPEARESMSVVLLAPVSNDDPLQAGFSLQSHLALWAQLQKAAAGDPQADAGRMLADAQRRSGINLRETALRQKFLEALQSRIIPAALVRGDLKAARSVVTSVAAYGAPWLASAGNSAHYWPDEQTLNKVMNDASLAVVPFAGPLAAQVALDAAATGCPVLLRESGSTSTWAKGISCIECYSDSETLAKRVKCWMDSEPLTFESRKTRCSEVKEHHSVVNRVQQIMLAQGIIREKVSPVSRHQLSRSAANDVSR